MYASMIECIWLLLFSVKKSLFGLLASIVSVWSHPEEFRKKPENAEKTGKYRKLPENTGKIYFHAGKP